MLNNHSTIQVGASTKQMEASSMRAFQPITKLQKTLSSTIYARRRGYRDLDQIREAKNRVKLNKSVFSNKKQFREIFNDFMAPRQNDTSKAAYQIVDMTATANTALASNQDLTDEVDPVSPSGGLQKQMHQTVPVEVMMGDKNARSAFFNDSVTPSPLMLHNSGAASPAHSSFNRQPNRTSKEQDQRRLLCKSTTLDTVKRYVPFLNERSPLGSLLEK